jgi:hypothetical protein
LPHELRYIGSDGGVGIADAAFIQCPACVIYLLHADRPAHQQPERVAVITDFIFMASDIA